MLRIVDGFQRFQDVLSFKYIHFQDLVLDDEIQMNYCRWCFLENYIVTIVTRNFRLNKSHDVSRPLFSESQVSDIASPQAKELLGWLVQR